MATLTYVSKLAPALLFRPRASCTEYEKKTCYMSTADHVSSYAMYIRLIITTGKEQSTASSR